jgi:hypothetical protein
MPTVASFIRPGLVKISFAADPNYDVYYELSLNAQTAVRRFM